MEAWKDARSRSDSPSFRITDHADEEAEADRLTFDEVYFSVHHGSVPVCGGEMVRKTVEKLLRGDQNIAVLHVDAEVCLRCGERLYPEEAVRRFEQIRAKLARDETADFQLLGHSFQIG